MDLERVKEILAAEAEIPVVFHGRPIWIESIDQTSSMALISAQGSHEAKQLVSIDGLAEE